MQPNILKRIFKRVLPPKGKVRLKEASLSGHLEGLDSDEHLYRPLTDSSSRDLSPLKQERAIKIAYYLYKTNPMAFRLTEDMKDWVIGKGIAYEHANPLLKGVLDRHWKDWVNQWELSQHAFIRDLGLFGELCLPAFFNRANGHVRLGVLDPERIQRVEPDPENARVVRRVIQKGSGPLRSRAYEIIRVDEDPRSPSFGRLTGQAFYFAVNRASTATRGTPDLLTLADFLDAYDQFLFDDMERTVLAKRFVFDLRVDNATEADLRRKAAQLKRLKPGATHAHNENEELRAVSPDLKSQDTSQQARLYRGHILGGAGFAEHFFGLGGDVNRATAAEMADPIVKRINGRQEYARHMISAIFRFVLDQWWLANPELRGGLGIKDPSDLDEISAVLHDFSVIIPEPTSRDLSRGASALSQGISAVQMAEASGYIRHKTAAQATAVLLGEIGLDVNATSELEGMKEEKKERVSLEFNGADQASTSPVLPEGG